MDLWNEAVSVFSHPYWHEEEEERRERKERKKILLPLSSSFSSSSSSSSPSQKGRTKTGGKKTIPEKTKVSISRIFRGLITACYDYNWFLAEPLLSSLLSLRNIEIPRKAKYPVMKIGFFLLLLLFFYFFLFFFFFFFVLFFLFCFLFSLFLLFTYLFFFLFFLSLSSL